MSKLYRCLGCHKEFSKEDLSHSTLCYDCAKKATIVNFERMWQIKKAIQEEKRAIKNTDEKSS